MSKEEYHIKIIEKYFLSENIIAMILYLLKHIIRHQNFFFSLLDAMLFCFSDILEKEKTQLCCGLQAWGEEYITTLLGSEE